MKTICKILAFVFLLTSVTGCCDRRCGVHGSEVPEPISPQTKLVKMKEQVGDKASK